MSGIELVCLDVGGVMYADAVYRRAILRALRELGASMTDVEFDAAYEECRREQRGSFRRRLAGRFLLGAASGTSDLDAAAEEVRRRASAHWSYPPGALETDVLPCLREVKGRGYRLAVVANQPSSIRAVLRRDGLDGFFDVWAISGELGFEKPDPRMLEHVLANARVAPDRATMVGDRLDDDIVPAKAAGLRAVWVLRGEAPHEPTAEQLAVPDASIRSLAGLARALESPDVN
jgi:HAD superfamily hydrolase (TIGR01662 family)